jgi:hypothetical protein
MLVPGTVLALDAARAQQEQQHRVEDGEEHHPPVAQGPADLQPPECDHAGHRASSVRRLVRAVVVPLGDRHEGLLEAQRADLDLLRAKALVEQGVEGLVRIRGLDVHVVVHHVQRDHVRQVQQLLAGDAGQPEGDPLEAGHRLDVGDGAVRQQPPLVDDDHLVGDLVRLLQVVRGEQDRLAALGLGLHRVPEDLPVLHVHAGGRLVQHDQVAVPGDRHGEADPLGLAAGELAGLAVGEVGDVRPLHHLVHRQRLRVQLGHQVQQFAHGDVGGQAAGLQHGAHVAARHGLPRRLAEDLDPPLEACLSPSRISMEVDLPAPFGPRKATARPCGSWSVSSRTAWTWP